MQNVIRLNPDRSHWFTIIMTLFTGLLISNCAPQVTSKKASVNFQYRNIDSALITQSSLPTRMCLLIHVTGPGLNTAGTGPGNDGEKCTWGPPALGKIYGLYQPGSTIELESLDPKTIVDPNARALAEKKYLPMGPDRRFDIVAVSQDELAQITGSSATTACENYEFIPIQTADGHVDMDIASPRGKFRAPNEMPWYVIARGDLSNMSLGDNTVAIDAIKDDNGQLGRPYDCHKDEIKIWSFWYGTPNMNDATQALNGYMNGQCAKGVNVTFEYSSGFDNSNPTSLSCDPEANSTHTGHFNLSFKLAGNSGLRRITARQTLASGEVISAFKEFTWTAPPPQVTFSESLMDKKVSQLNKTQFPIKGSCYPDGTINLAIQQNICTGTCTSVEIASAAMNLTCTNGQFNTFANFSSLPDGSFRFVPKIDGAIVNSGWGNWFEKSTQYCDGLNSNGTPNTIENATDGSSIGLKNNSGDTPGSINRPYIICNKQQLGMVVNYPNAYYELGNDIDFSGVTNPIIGSNSTPLTFNLNGQNFSIKNVAYSYQSTPISRVGLFRYLGTNASIQNVRLKNFDVRGNISMAGLLVGYTQGANILFKDITINDSTIVGDSAIGGLIGASGQSGYSSVSYINNIRLENVTVGGTNNSIGRIGGLVGQCWSCEIQQSTFNGIVRGVSAINSLTSIAAIPWVGGMVGEFSSDSNNKIVFSWVSPKDNQPLVQSFGPNIGGLVGSMNGGKIKYSNVDGSVVGSFSNSSSFNVGGIVGSQGANVDILNSSFYGSQVIGQYAVAGIAGESYGNIFDSKAEPHNGSGNNIIEGIHNVGGLIGFQAGNNRTYTRNSISYYSINSHDEAISGSIPNSNVGGLIGRWNGDDVIVSDSYANLNIVNCHADTADTTATFCGGLVGYLVSTDPDNKITRSYFRGGLSGGSTDSIGGLVGRINAVNDTITTLAFAVDDQAYNNIKFENNFWYTMGGGMTSASSIYDAGCVLESSSNCNAPPSGLTAPLDLIGFQADVNNPVDNVKKFSTEADLKDITKVSSLGFTNSQMWRMPHVPTAAGSMDWPQNNGYPVINDWVLNSGNFLGQNRKTFQVYCSNPSGCSSGSQLTVNFWGTPQELNSTAVKANLEVYKSSVVAGVRVYTPLYFNHIVNGDEKYFRVNLGVLSMSAGETLDIQIYYKASSNSSYLNSSLADNNHNDINNWGGNNESVP